MTLIFSAVVGLLEGNPPHNATTGAPHDGNGQKYRVVPRAHQFFKLILIGLEAKA